MQLLCQFLLSFQWYKDMFQGHVFVFGRAWPLQGVTHFVTLRCLSADPSRLFRCWSIFFTTQKKTKKQKKPCIFSLQAVGEARRDITTKHSSLVWRSQMASFLRWWYPWRGVSSVPEIWTVSSTPETAPATQLIQLALWCTNWHKNSSCVTHEVRGPTRVFHVTQKEKKPVKTPLDQD